MAVFTKFYPTTIAPHAGFIEGAHEGDWAAGFERPPWYPPQWLWHARPVKDNGGVATTRTYKTNQQGNYDIVTYSWLVGPLAAQTITGNFDMCFWPAAQWLSPSPTSPSIESIVRWKVHAYVTQGFSTTPRSTLIDNYVDSLGAFEFPDGGFDSWVRMANAAPITSQTCFEGDFIRLEIGVRIEESPIETPNYFPTETWATSVRLRHLVGTTDASNVAHSDAAPGDTSTSRSGWFEFSAGLDVLDDTAAAPANDACVDAVVIASLPYDSPRIDTSGSTGTQKEVWYSYTAAANGVIFITTFSSTYNISISVLAGSCAGAATGVNGSAMGPGRSLTIYRFTATAGQTYYVRVRNATLTTNAINSGGSLSLQMFYRQDPAEDDLYLPCAVVAAIRDGVVVNVTPDFAGSLPTGVAIDYSGLSMDALGGGTHTGERLLLGLHDFDLTEILDLPTLSIGGPEIDFIGDPWDVALITQHPATLAIARGTNQLYQAFFGNGYLLVIGQGVAASARPAVLNTISNNVDYPAIKQLSVIAGDSQSGAPYTDTLHYPDVEVTAAWAISLDESTGDIYFTSGGFYYPVGGQTVRKYNINTGLTTTFATLSARPGNNPGLKGLQFLPGGGLLVCNADIVQRLDSSGTVVGTFTPSVALDSQNLGDVKLTADGTQFWTVDIPTARLFLVDIATMEEVATYPTYLGVGILVQMAIYQPTPPPPPPTPGVGVSLELPECPDTFLVDEPEKPLPYFLRTRGYNKQGPAPSGDFDTDPAPGTGLGSRFKG